MIDGLMSSDDGGNKKRRAEKQWRREEVEAGLDERDEPVVRSCAFRCRSHLTMLIGSLPHARSKEMASRLHQRRSSARGGTSLDGLHLVVLSRMLHKIANLTLQFAMHSFVRVGRRRGAAPEEATATAAAPAPVFNFAAPVVAAAPEAEKEKKDKEKEETTQAAEQPEKEEKKEEKEKEKEEKEEEQKPSEEDKKETTKVDFGKTPENVRSPRALSLSAACGAKRVYVLLYTTDHGGSVQLRPASYLLPHHGGLCVWRFVEHDYRLDGTVVT